MNLKDSTLKPLIECVPNFSEGRRQHVIDAIIDPFKDRKGCFLLDYQAAPDHNRLVVSLAGDPDPIQDALLDAAAAAISHIDMDVHRGGHPRIGAADVIPFVPVRNIPMTECVRIAHAFGRRFADETGVPVYFYEEAALSPERKQLEIIRRGEYRATELVRAEAARWRVDIAETEICGMIPASALLDSLSYYMQISGLKPSHVLELKLTDAFFKS